MKWRTLVLLSALLETLGLPAACTPAPVKNGPLFGSGVLHPPPTPGDSISNTQMCECETCDPVACCEGPEDDAAAETSGSIHDFSSNPSYAGLAVRSCQSRCTRQVWRVHVGQPCSSKHPDSCCAAG